MISYVRGELVDVLEDKAVVDVNGFGMGIFLPGRNLGQLPRIGDEVKIHTYFSVKEDSMQLFGFLKKEDLKIFRQVITVSGIGPKGGLAILSQFSADELRLAVLAGDAKAISATPGIGKKTAEKLILELKDKMDIAEVLERETETVSVTEGSNGELQNDAVAALIALGYGYRIFESSKTGGSHRADNYGRYLETGIKKYDVLIDKG